jgi:hypothetical protein
MFGDIITNQWCASDKCRIDVVPISFSPHRITQGDHITLSTFALIHPLFLISNIMTDRTLPGHKDLSILYSYRDFAVKIAREAGQAIREAFQQRHGYPISDTRSNTTTIHNNTYYTEAKDGNSSDPVTETDRFVERQLRERITTQYPNHRCVGEEFGTDHGGKVVFGPEPTWVIDPIDGTANFVHG